MKGLAVFRQDRQSIPLPDKATPRPGTRPRQPPLERRPLSPTSRFADVQRRQSLRFRGEAVVRWVRDNPLQSATKV